MIYSAKNMFQLENMVVCSQNFFAIKVSVLNSITDINTKKYTGSHYLIVGGTQCWEI
jgi:hypothetical protein